MVNERMVNTPCFLIHKAILDENVRAFAGGMKRHWPNSRLSYSVKTNSLPWVLRYMRAQGIMAEVVSDEEYELALRCGFGDDEIVFNGPIKGEALFARALRGGAYVNLDSRRELEWLKALAPIEAVVGLRINVPPEVFRAQDIGYRDEGFRFGYSDESGALGEALECVREGVQPAGIGLHLHCNSITRDVEVYRAIARYAVQICKKHGVQPRYIDIGGGFFGGVPGKATPDDYFSAIAGELNQSALTRGATLIAEPGSALVGSAMDLVTTVLDVKDTAHARIVTTDGSRIHIDPLWKKERYLYAIEAKKREPYAGDQVICGYTCMDHDRLMRLANETELSVGDRITYRRVGAYAVTFGGPFIRYFPEVYVEDGARVEKVRGRISTEDYYNIHSN